MGNLILNSLEVKGFRAFQHLQIERLGRVNLIVGKNNIGKTSLLEALYIYACRAPANVIWEMMETRDEGVKLYPDNYADLERRSRDLKYLFYGRKDLRTHPEPIQIGPINSLDEALSISLEGYTGRAGNAFPHLTIRMGTETLDDYPLDPSVTYKILRSDEQDIRAYFITAYGLDKKQLASLWDHVSLTSSEKVVLDALRMVAPGVEGFNFIGEPVVNRIPWLKIKGIEEPVPLRSLGDGMQRVLNIALALVNAKNGIVLIDEVENGIHHGVQLELWQMIFELAHRLNIQVFATTHDWDCLKGFQKAAQEDTQEEGVLIRLSPKKGDIHATLFDEEELGIATREQIEVR